MLGLAVQRSSIPAQRLLHTSRAALQVEPASSKPLSSSSQTGEAGPSRKTPAPFEEPIEGSPEKPSFTASASARHAAQDKRPLAPLSAPLGVRTKPSSRKLSWTERREQALDYDRRMETRKAM